MPNFERIPQELRMLRQWIVWKYEEGNDKPTKVPYKIDLSARASVTDPFTWGTFEAACLVVAHNKADGIGFVFTKSDPYAGIDLDASHDAEIIARQENIFKTFNSYSESSPSGKGLHIIIKASVFSGRRRSNIELYSSERFFTMTGDVFNDAPIADCQALADILWAEMGKVKNVTGFQGNYEELASDAEIVAKALNAVNGDKFKILADGNWQDIYKSQSEADFAFVDIIAFYSQNRNQIARIFRNSPLGARDKAQRSDYMEYMLNKAFDRMLPLVDIEGLQNAFEEAKARARLTVAGEPPEGLGTAIPKAVSARPSDSPANPYILPPGLLGEIASFIYAAAPRPVPEIALAGAIGLMAGICGRAYNVSNTGLNQYVLLLAQTGVGKEAMASGIDKLVMAIRDEIPAIREFVGPSDIASGQALLKYMSKTSACFLSIIGEFGLKMQQLSHNRANSSEIMLKRILLDMYNKSGVDRSVQASIYSQKENNTDVILAPSLTILGESTPNTFYAAIDEGIITDGLLPRFTVVEYKGDRPNLNEDFASTAVPEALRKKLADLTAYCLKLGIGANNRPLAVEVKFSSEAKLAVNHFNLYADDLIRGSKSNAVRDLWSRAHVKLMKLAALVAVGINPFDPIITIENVQWARRIVYSDISRLIEKLETGQFGSDNEETKQLEDIRGCFKEYLEKDYKDLKGYDIDSKLHAHKIIPYAFLSRRLLKFASFRKDRLGATAALKRGIALLTDNGVIKEIGKNELQTKYLTSQRSFMVANTTWLLGDISEK